ncbi:MAG TPA: alpha/beta hydrolase [Acidimicrobiia bacterium]|nr:alpha/beta hydrolase [Acidimicrobiia bacterium]
MPLHPDARTMIDGMMGSGIGLGADASPVAVRELMRSMLPPVADRPPVHSVTDSAVPGPAGDLAVRVYRPTDAAVLPGIVWLHGGGFVIGDLETHDSMLRMLAVDVGAAIVSVDYRLAPEHKFPAAVDDVSAAWSWIAGHAADLGIDPSHLALGGDSAGGCLAIVATLAARDAGAPLPAFVLLVYPVTDLEYESTSMRENASGYYLEVEGIRWYNAHYARSDADHDDWRYSPLRAPSLAAFPRALVITAEYDPLRDQGEAFAARVRAEGGDARVLRADGLFHGFFGMHPFLAPARPAWDDAVGTLRRALRAEGGG